MQYIVDDRIIIDYPATEQQWVVTDTATDQVAKTPDVTALPDIIFAFGGPDIRQAANEDADPHA